MRFSCDFLPHFLLGNWAHYSENVAKQAFVCSAFIITVLYQNRAQSIGKTECEKRKQTRKLLWSVVDCDIPDRNDFLNILIIF